MPIPPYKRPDPERINLAPVYLTPEGIERLHEKLERLKRNLPSLAEEAARTAAFGDRSDNAEYKQAKGALRYTQRETYRIEDQLKRVVTITRGTDASGAVRLGSIVTVRTTDKREQTFEILGPDETNPTKGRISNKSPLGTALVGRKEGDVISVKAANGAKKYTIIAVR